MLPLYKKYWRTFFDIGLIVLTVYLVMFAFSKLYHLAAPVFLSFFVFLIIEPLARFLNRRGIGKPFASAISVLFFLVLLLGTLFGAGLLITSQVLHFQDNVPKYTYIVQEHFTELTTYLQHKIDSLPPDMTDKVNGYFKSATNTLSSWLVVFFKYMIGMLGSFSSFMGNFGVAIILAFFLSMEIKDWKKIAHDKMPKTLKTAYAFLQGNVFKAIGSYLKAQLILIAITFVIVLVGLFIVGNSSLAIGLIVLLAVVLIVRQLLEPKITGNSIGVSSAFLMLSFVILSMSAFGVAGLILSPILLILIKELIQQGYLQRWIFLPQEEFIVSPFAATASEADAQGGDRHNEDETQRPADQAPEDTDSKSNT